MSAFPETSDEYSKRLHKFLQLVKETIAEVTWQNGKSPDLHGPKMIDPFPAMDAA